MKTTSCKALVQPLEYASSIWVPYTQKGIRQIEKVRRLSARYVLNRHRNRFSPTEMLGKLGWLSLEERRRQQRLTMLFKIANGIVAVDADQYLTPLFHTHKSRYHPSQAFVVPHSNTDYQQSSFFICM